MFNKLKERDSNIELYRIFLMIFIIAHHYVVNSGVMNNIYSDIFSSKSIYLAMFGAWGKVGINCFLLITGYFMCKSNISLKKFLKLLLEVEFYKIIVYLIFLITRYSNFEILDFVRTILPVSSIADNFVGCYLVFYLFIPFINILIKNLSKKSHLLLILLLFFTYSVLGNIPKINVVINYLSLFFMIYLIGAYIRLYGIKLLESKKKCILINVMIVTLCISSIILGMFVYKKYNINMIYFFITDSNKVLAVLLSISLFYLFKNIKMKNSKFINRIATSVFGVLLIHANSDTMRNFLWKDFLNVVNVYNNSIYYVILHSIISVLVIFIVCVIIDQIRIRFIETPFFFFLSDKIDKWEKLIMKKL